MENEKQKEREEGSKG